MRKLIHALVVFALLASHSAQANLVNQNYNQLGLFKKTWTSKEGVKVEWQDKRDYIKHYQDFFERVLNLQSIENRKRMACLEDSLANNGVRNYKRVEADQIKALFITAQSFKDECKDFFDGSKSKNKIKQLSPEDLLLEWLRMRNNALLSEFTNCVQPGQATSDEWGRILNFHVCNKPRHLFKSFHSALFNKELPTIPDLYTVEAKEIAQMNRYITSVFRRNRLEFDAKNITPKYEKITKAEKDETTLALLFDAGKISLVTYDTKLAELNNKTSSSSNDATKKSEYASFVRLNTPLIAPLALGGDNLTAKNLREMNKNLYTKLLNSRPILGIWAPSKESISRYVNEKVFDKFSIYESLLKALKISQQFHDELIQDFKQKDPDQDYLSMLPMLSSQAMRAHFNSQVSNATQTVQDRVFKDFNTKQYWILGGSIVGAVGIGIACGLITVTPPGRAVGFLLSLAASRALLCSFGVNAGVNVTFFAYSERGFKQHFLKIFSASGLGKGEAAIVLEDLGQLKEAQVELIINAIALPIGTGVAPLVKQLISGTSLASRSKILLNNFIDKRR